MLWAHQQLFSPQLLLPFTTCQLAAVEERAVACIARLLAFSNTCPLPEVGSPFAHSSGDHVLSPRPEHTRLQACPEPGLGPAVPLSHAPLLPLSPVVLLLHESCSVPAQLPGEPTPPRAGEAGRTPHPVLQLHG